MIQYRWEADVADFRMPVKAGADEDHMEFIYPITEWRTMTLKNTLASDFVVDEERFYIQVTETDE